jgi:D-alanyl-D-alanine carboxypeptidase/D-alanyl-D-alanine-endopeptidase (penicillin-binding protein 4)
MADRQRRSPASAAAQVVLVVLLGTSLGLLAFALRARLGAPPATQAGGAPSAQPGGARSPQIVRLHEPLGPAADDARHLALQGRVEGIVSAAVARAARATQGAATSASVRVAVHVRELESGVELAALRADDSLRPASNMKLVTTAAALVLLGSEARFVTPIEASGPIQDGVLAGDLVLRAGGDPLIRADGDARVEERLGQALGALRSNGLQHIRGDVILDEASFPDPGPGPAWPDASQHWAEFCALAGGFSINGGVLRATVLPGAPGARAAVEVHPAPFGLPARFDVRTTAGGRLDVQVGATPAACTVQGSLPRARSDFSAEFRHPDPVQLFASVLADQLAACDIGLDGTLRRARDIAPGVRLGTLESPIADALGPINSESRNGVADQLFLALGLQACGAGTRTAGRAAVGRALVRLGVPDDGLVQVDGSGLSRDDRVSARQITALLAAVLASDERGARLFVESLAVMGRRGTLAERLQGSAGEGRVRAKTGWIAGTSALSGLATGPHGETLVFSILVEYPSSIGGLNQDVFKPMQDELALCLVQEAP